MRTSNLPAAVVPITKSLERRARELNSHQLNEAAALTSQRVLGAWEKLRRAVARLLVAGDRHAGFVTSGQTFGICCHSGESRRRDFLRCCAECPPAAGSGTGTQSVPIIARRMSAAVLVLMVLIVAFGVELGGCDGRSARIVSSTEAYARRPGFLSGPHNQ